MRVKSFSISILAAAAFLIMGLGVSSLEASQYLGEVIWNGQDSDGGAFTMKAGLSRVGDSYYEIQGQKIDSAVSIFSGGGVLVGSNLILTVTQTPTDKQRFGVLQITIDKTTCNGTFYKLKPVFYIPQYILPSASDPLPENYPAGAQIYSQATVGEQGFPPPSGSLTATKSVVLTANSTAALPLLLE
jgi:hypothetical protein